MSLEIEYERPYQRNEHETYKMFLFNMFVILMNQCIQKKTIDSILDKDAKVFVPYTLECEHQLDFRSTDEDKPCGVATV